MEKKVLNKDLNVASSAALVLKLLWARYSSSALGQSISGVKTNERPLLHHVVS